LAGRTATDSSRTSSDEQGASGRGSEIGWLTEAQMIPAIRAVVTALPKDLVSDPIRLDDGWHVVKLLDTTPARRGARGARGRDAQASRADPAQGPRGPLLEENPPVINELALSKALEKR
jgi:parvulin-like peptidyl-prolyl isomerase